MSIVKYADRDNDIILDRCPNVGRHYTAESHVKQIPK
jgi:hypothetical protein